MKEENKEVILELRKEVLALILNEDIKDIYKLGSNPNFDENELLYSVHGIGDLYHINLDTLTRKTKEWVFKSGCSIEVELIDMTTYRVEIDRDTDIIYNEHMFHTTELQSVMNAAIWLVGEYNCSV